MQLSTTLFREAKYPPQTSYINPANLRMYIRLTLFVVISGMSGQFFEQTQYVGAPTHLSCLSVCWLVGLIVHDANISILALL